MSEDAAARGAGVRSPERNFMDLKTRAVSAFALAALALGSNFAGALPFAVLVALLSLVMTWEWGRVSRGGAIDAAFAAQAAAVLAAAGLAAMGLAAWSLAALVAGTILAAPLASGSSARLSALGVCYVGLPAAALVWLRGSEPEGAWAILFVFLVVWVYDTAAFAAGSLIGGPKLWPSVSPKKTWAGLLGGVAASALAGASFAVFALGAAPARLAFWGAAFGAVAQAGDLLESGLKRWRGVKDTSGLVPGHGGVMDRLDSIVAVAAAAALVALAIDPRSPARALLFGG